MPGVQLHYIFKTMHFSANYPIFFNIAFYLFAEDEVIQNLYCIGGHKRMKKK